MSETNPLELTDKISFQNFLYAEVLHIIRMTASEQLK